MDVEFKQLKIREISVATSYSCSLIIRGLFENAPLGLGICFVSPWRDAGDSDHLCLAFCQEAVCCRFSHTTLKWENFGSPAARTDILNGTFFFSIENCSAARTG